jgi:hypothetical protein
MTVTQERSRILNLFGPAGAKSGSKGDVHILKRSIEAGDVCVLIQMHSLPACWAAGREGRTKQSPPALEIEWLFREWRVTSSELQQLIEDRLFASSVHFTSARERVQNCMRAKWACSSRRKRDSLACQ